MEDKSLLAPKLYVFVVNVSRAGSMCYDRVWIDFW